MMKFCCWKKEYVPHEPKELNEASLELGDQAWQTPVHLLCCYFFTESVCDQSASSAG